MINSLFKILSWGLLPLYFGGGGGSTQASTNTTTTTSNSDSRMVVSDSGTGVSGNSGTVSIMSTDHGAVSGVFDFLKMATAAQQTNYDKLLTGTGQALQGILTTTNETKNGGKLDSKTITLLGVGALAVVGLFVWRKK